MAEKGFGLSPKPFPLGQLAVFQRVVRILINSQSIIYFYDGKMIQCAVCKNPQPFTFGE